MVLPKELQGAWSVLAPAQLVKLKKGETQSSIGQMLKFTLTDTEAVVSVKGQEIKTSLTWSTFSGQQIENSNVSFVLQVPAEIQAQLGGATQLTWVWEVESETKMKADIPSELIAGVRSEMASMGLDSGHIDPLIKTLTDEQFEANKGAGSGTETMLMVVLGLAVVWMLMNYKKR